MNLLELQIQAFLTKAVDQPVEVDPSLIEEFGEACKAAFRKQFTEPREREFRLRMSNIGRPVCTLQNEKAGANREPRGYNHIMKMLTGDLSEAALITIIKAAGVNVEDTNSKVSTRIGSATIDGTIDIRILENGVRSIYDIKTASPYAFNNKFKSFETVVADDPFGYASQGFGYAKDELNTRFGGWIVYEKSTGEIKVVPTPINETEYEAASKAALDKAANSIALVEANADIVKFEPIPETWYGKETGNKVLARPCVMCEFRSTCWPNAQYRQNPKSKSSTDWRWYTESTDGTT